MKAPKGHFEINRPLARGVEVVLKARKSLLPDELFPPPLFVEDVLKAKKSLLPPLFNGFGNLSAMFQIFRETKWINFLLWENFLSNHNSRFFFFSFSYPRKKNREKNQSESSSSSSSRWDREMVLDGDLIFGFSEVLSDNLTTDFLAF